MSRARIARCRSAQGAHRESRLGPHRTGSDSHRLGLWNAIEVSATQRMEEQLLDRAGIDRWSASPRTAILGMWRSRLGCSASRRAPSRLCGGLDGRHRARTTSIPVCSRLEVLRIDRVWVKRADVNVRLVGELGPQHFREAVHTELAGDRRWGERLTNLAENGSEVDQHTAVLPAEHWDQGCAR
jgi:hypothetical protein